MGVVGGWRCKPGGKTYGTQRPVPNRESASKLECGRNVNQREQNAVNQRTRRVSARHSTSALCVPAAVKNGNVMRIRNPRCWVRGQ